MTNLGLSYDINSDLQATWHTYFLTYLITGRYFNCSWL